MKKLLIGLVLSVAVSAPAFASDVTEGCEWVEGLAGSIMDARQKNASLVKMLEIAGDNEVFKSMTMDAYEQDAMSYEPNKVRQRAEFVNKWVMICIKAFGEKYLL